MSRMHFPLNPKGCTNVITVPTSFEATETAIVLPKRAKTMTALRLAVNILFPVRLSWDQLLRFFGGRAQV
jgi:hypothetical protein